MIDKMNYISDQSNESYKFPVETNQPPETSKLEQALSKLDSLETIKGNVKRYKEIVRSLYPSLNSEEQQQILEDPINFTSKSHLFRGLDRPTTAEFMISGEMQPQDGEYGGRAVYTSDRTNVAQLSPS